MRWWNMWPMVLLLTLILAACGGTGAPAAATTPTPETPATAEAVHQAWVQALRDNDRAAALRLMAPGIDPAYTDSRLSDRAQMVAGTEMFGAFVELGPLELRDVGAGKVGYSTWVFEQRTECYATSLALVDGGAWRVTQSGLSRMENCTAE